MINIALLIAGLILGLAVGIVFYLTKKSVFEAELGLSRARLGDAENTLFRERDNLNAFRGISSEVLKQTREEFIRQAEPKLTEHIAPLKEALARYEKAIGEIERRREDAYGGLKELMGNLNDGQKRLTSETGSLVAALKSPAARGRWGELTLKRVVEVAGMSQYCDFDEQITVGAEDARLRPDMVVRLAGGKSVVVDAKAPIDAYWSATESMDETLRKAGLVKHAQSVREHMRLLGHKSYWSQFENTPDFVVMFLPGESFFSAALEQDRTLIEDGIKGNVILATPTTLIVLLRSVAMGWQQQKVAENALRIAEAGKDLFERCQTFAGYISKVGQGIERATQAFNQAVGSWENRVLPGARRLKELGATRDTDATLPEIEPIERATRALSPAE
jgi:DNA recombination protein RmuC